MSDFDNNSRAVTVALRCCKTEKLVGLDKNAGGLSAKYASLGEASAWRIEGSTDEGFEIRDVATGKMMPAVVEDDDPVTKWRLEATKGVVHLQPWDYVYGYLAFKNNGSQKKWENAGTGPGGSFHLILAETADPCGCSALDIISGAVVAQLLGDEADRKAATPFGALEQECYDRCLAGEECGEECTVVTVAVGVLRGAEHGSDIDVGSVADAVAPEVNRLWEPARIRFEFTVDEVDVGPLRDAPPDDQGPNMKKLKAAPPLPPRRSTSDIHVYLWNMTGNKSQGVACGTAVNKKLAAGSPPPTIHLGTLTTKGLAEGAPAARRPPRLLARTLAHELGHALTLQHTRNRAFADGTPCNCSGTPNVMEGGKDSDGGGGHHLEPWQVLMAHAALKRLRELKRAES